MPNQQNEHVITQEQAQDVMDRALKLASEKLASEPLVAEVILKQLLKCDPKCVDGLVLYGLAKHRLGKNEEAVEIFHLALELDSNNAYVYNNLGVAYGALGEHERAIEFLQKALSLKENDFLFLNNLALQYRHIGEYEKAIDCLNRAISVNSSDPQLWTNLGGVYGELKDMDKTIYCLKHALDCDCDYAAAHVDLAFAYFLKGDWENGFREYEWRFKYFPQLLYYKKAYDQTKKWDGKSSLEGKTILVYAEQGMGDAIQFVRYAKHLSNLGAKVIFHCNKSLGSLFLRVDGVHDVCHCNIVTGPLSDMPEYDYQCPSMSIPYLLNDYRIKGTPYIFPFAKAADKMKRIINECYSNYRLKIGIVWAGSPAHPHDARRSIHLKHFRPIHDLPGVKLFSLQINSSAHVYDPKNDFGNSLRKSARVVDYTSGAEDMKIVDMTNVIQTFDDTCTVLHGLDLVVACDTAIVHLAGAMGKPCYVAIPYNPDWRWGLEGGTTPWYDSIRLFRQKQRDNWEQVFCDIRDAIVKNYLS